MACPAIITGNEFLTRLLAHIDCQAQVIGSYGYQALGQPGSLASVVMTGLLTLFIALFAIRLLFGPAPGARDVVFDILKIGIVLTLAFSWPAFRTVVYDVTLKGPAEIATSIQTASIPQSGQGFAERLQGADNAIVRLTERGTGRNSGAFIDGDTPGGTFRGSALEDESALGWARLSYLAGIIGSIGLLRIAGGLLLALAPLAAGLLLFEQTRGLFAGWLRGLVLVMIGSLGSTIVLAVQLAAIEPWLADALRVRTLGYATPAAPIELLAMTLGFAVIQIGMLALMLRIAFNRGWITLPSALFARRESALFDRQPAFEPAYVGPSSGSRVERISESVATQMRREEHSSERRIEYRGMDGGGTAASAETAPASVGPPRLGSSYRRTHRRSSIASIRRDN